MVCLTSSTHQQTFSDSVSVLLLCHGEYQLSSTCCEGCYNQSITKRNLSVDVVLKWIRIKSMIYKDLSPYILLVTRTYKRLTKAGCGNKYLCSTTNVASSYWLYWNYTHWNTHNECTLSLCWSTKKSAILVIKFPTNLFAGVVYKIFADILRHQHYTEWSWHAYQRYE